MRLLFLFLTFITFAAAGAAGQEPPRPQSTSVRFIGRPVVAVRLTIEGTPTVDPALLDLLETRVGAPLSMADVRESISHLLGIRRFQDVVVDAQDAPTGVELTYNLVPLHGVEAIQFKGALGLSEGLLRRTLTGRFGESPPAGRAPEIARILQEQLYADHGYLRASVKASAVEEHDPDRTLLVFDIASGPKARIGHVTLEGEPGEAPDAFLRKIGATTGAAYEPLQLGEALTRYAEAQRRAARYDATADYRARVSPDGAIVDLDIEVQPGSLVRIQVEGDPLPPDRIDELVPVKRETSAHEDLIEDSEVRIRTFLAQQGYWKASATSRTEEAGGVRTVTFTVRKGLQYRIADGVEVRGARAIPVEQLKPALVRLQGGDIFVSANLDAAASAIEGAYRERGFAQIRVDPAANELNPTPAGLGQVKPVIVIDEGQQIRIGAIAFEGAAQIAEEHLRALLRVRTGDPFVAGRIADDRERIVLEYLNEGYASAEAEVVPTLSADGTRADLAIRIAEGQQTRVDHILIAGNEDTAPEVIRRELLFHQGEPLGLADLAESRRRVTALGLFRRVQISELSHGRSGQTDVLVAVEEAPRTTVSYGGGLEASRRLRATGPEGVAEPRIEFAPRGFFDIGRRNVGGKNRSMNLYTRVSLRPNDAPDETDGEGFGFSDYRVVGTYREPRPFGVNGDLTLTGALEQGVRTTFNFIRRGVTTELVRRFTPGIRGSGRYSLSTTKILDARVEEKDQALIDRRFPQVRLSTLAAAISRDTRDDVLEPTRGTFLSLEGSIATRALGGEVGFLKSYGQAIWFTQVPGKRSIVFASRIAVGLADGFPRTVQQTGASGQPEDVVVEDLPASERFFAGGDTTIRGFTLDLVGTAPTISPKGFPLGGNAVVLLNGELRVPVWSTLAAAVFVDGGNVFSRASHVDFGDLRASAGVGLRYRSPVGPIRLDVGFRLNRRDLGFAESPRAFHFSFGQAF